MFVINGLLEDSDYLLVQVLEADEVQDSGDLCHHFCVAMGINGEQLLQMGLLFLQFLHNHPWCELIHSIHAHLYYA